jgi:hypothetical protein
MRQGFGVGLLPFGLAKQNAFWLYFRGVGRRKMPKFDAAAA